MGINKELIKSAIVDREEELNERVKNERIIERELKISDIEKDIATIITGIRRAGKSIYSYLLTKKSNAVYVNFEDERINIEAKDLNYVLEAIYELKGNVEFMVFDEIQNIEGWERFVSRILSKNKIIITGSNAKLLSKELSTFLTGRHINYELFPFSFREFLEYENFKPNIYLTKDIAKTKRLLEEYLNKGGIPLTYKHGSRFIVELYKDIIERDVAQRYNIKYLKLLKNIAMYYISNISSLISFNKIKNIYGVKSVETIKNYSDYLSNAYLIFFIQKFSYKLKEQEISPKKVYCMDNGILTTMGFRFRENISKLMENTVGVDILRRKSYWYNSWEIFYFRDYQQHEVDFVIKEGFEVRQLIQVTYASHRDEIERREIRSLIKVSDLLKCKNLLVITWDYESKEEVKGKTIRFMPLWKWLLEN